MKYRIHYTLQGEDGSIIVEGTTIKEVQDKAQAHLRRVGGTDPWSEEL